MREQYARFKILNRYAMDVMQFFAISTRGPGWIKTFLKMVWTYWSDLSTRRLTRRDRRFTQGAALMGHLYKRIFDRGIELRLDSDFAQQTATDSTFFVTGGGGMKEGEGASPTVLREAGLIGSSPMMWQVHNTYILAETRTGLILVDQHSAHERVLYEELMRSYDETAPDSQRLLFPITLRLSPAECAVIEQLSALFTRMGFEIEPFGGRSVIVQAVPVPHPYFDADRCLREMIAELTEGSPLVDSARTQHQRIALSMACKGAIKAGQKLTAREMSELFDRLFGNSQSEDTTQSRAKRDLEKKSILDLFKN